MSAVVSLTLIPMLASRLDASRMVRMRKSLKATAWFERIFAWMTRPLRSRTLDLGAARTAHNWVLAWPCGDFVAHRCGSS